MRKPAAAERGTVATLANFLIGAGRSLTCFMAPLSSSTMAAKASEPNIIRRGGVRGEVSVMDDLID